MLERKTDMHLTFTFEMRRNEPRKIIFGTACTYVWKNAEKKCPKVWNVHVYFAELKCSKFDVH